MTLGAECAQKILKVSLMCLRVQGWRSGESTRLPPLWPGFDSQIRRQMWVELFGSLLCTEMFSPGTPKGFPFSSKTKI